MYLNKYIVELDGLEKVIAFLLKCFIGYIHGIDAFNCGVVAHHLGAGRILPHDKIDYAVGIELKVQVGDFVNKGKT